MTSQKFLLSNVQKPISKIQYQLRLIVRCSRSHSGIPHNPHLISQRRNDIFFFFYGFFFHLFSPSVSQTNSTVIRSRNSGCWYRLKRGLIHTPCSKQLSSLPSIVIVYNSELLRGLMIFHAGQMLKTFCLAVPSMDFSIGSVFIFTNCIFFFLLYGLCSFVLY